MSPNLWISAITAAATAFPTVMKCFFSVLDLERSRVLLSVPESRSCVLCICLARVWGLEMGNSPLAVIELERSRL
ncbi:hypothetical protein SDJN02_20082 [Cucurbita argyrosperma subsp. argyrosperma]|nr:hypothetical protein SDJN02_20082 [Cucurbita argyrosperma subsp. argyrosperma]